MPDFTELMEQKLVLDKFKDERLHYFGKKLLYKKSRNFI